MSSTNSLDRVSPAARAALDRGGLLYIDNSWQAAADGRTIPVIDPSSGKEVSRIAAGSESDIHQAVAAAKRALSNPAWRDLAPIARERLIWRLAQLLEENAQMLAEVETIDAGMPIWMSRNLTIAGAAEILRYMAGWSSKIHGRTVPVAVGIPY